MNVKHTHLDLGDPVCEHLYFKARPGRVDQVVSAILNKTARASVDHVGRSTMSVDVHCETDQDLTNEAELLLVLETDDNVESFWYEEVTP